MKNLIFIEGVSGAGKSTTTPKLCEKLRESGYTTVYHLEGDIQSPVDSFWNACLTKTEYKNVCNVYPDFTLELSKNSINGDDYVLVRYQDFVILDGSFLHHQINDLIRNYNASEKDITNHLIELLQAVQSLNPIVFYFTAQDVGERLTKAWDSRGKAAPTKDDIAFWTSRKDMDLRVLKRLPVESHILDISDENWNSALDAMLMRVSKNTPVIEHYDALIDESNDPVFDPEPLKAHMDKWDGEPFIEAMQLTPGKSVLEIGIGTGRLTVRVCDKCGSFTGIDISPKTVERAKENLRRFPNVRLVCDDFLSHSFDETFNVIYSSLTFMHIKDKRAAIQKAADILTCGGRFVLSISKHQQTMLDFGNRQIKVYPDTPDEIASLLIGAGLTIEKQFETEFAVVFVSAKGV